jgi:hypothetical protein
MPFTRSGEVVSASDNFCNFSPLMLQKKSFMWKQIFKATVIAGCLDITAAFIQTYLTKTLTPDVVLKYIASGVFGKDVKSGGVEFILFGLFVHFLISFAIVVTYFIVYPKLRLLHKNIFINSFFVAIIAWAITTRIIIPLSKIQPQPFNFTKALIAIAILYVCIGLPITYLAKQFYSKK